MKYTLNIRIARLKKRSRAKRLIKYFIAFVVVTDSRVHIHVPYRSFA